MKKLMALLTITIAACYCVNVDANSDFMTKPQKEVYSKMKDNDLVHFVLTFYNQPYLESSRVALQLEWMKMCILM